MSRARRQKMDAAVKSIREFWHLGRSLPARQSPQAVYGDAINKTTAERVGMNHDTVGKARGFANPVSGYTFAEMNELCRTIKEVQPTQDEKRNKTKDKTQNKTPSVFGRTHVVRLVSVPKRFRDDLQKRAIKGGWSCRELERRIASMLGSRSDQGRSRRIPDDVRGQLVQIEEMCNAWIRWSDAVDEKRREGRKVRPRPADVPADVRRLVDAVMKEISVLQNVVANVELAGERKKHFTEIRHDELMKEKAEG